MKYFSTFSGIGGFELGIKQAYESNNEYAHKCEKSKQKKCSQGRKRSVDKHKILLHDRNRTAPLCVGYSEIDRYAVQVYNKQFNHKNYGDITKIDTSKLPDFDLLVGGFPCQAFSIAGKRKGFDDTRGTLFFDLVRIARDKKPKFIVLENVKGLLSSKTNLTFERIIDILFIELTINQNVCQTNFTPIKSWEMITDNLSVYLQSIEKTSGLQEKSEYLCEMILPIMKKLNLSKTELMRVLELKEEEWDLNLKWLSLKENLTTVDIGTLERMVNMLGGVGWLLKKHLEGNLKNQKLSIILTEINKTTNLQISLYAIQEVIIILFIEKQKKLSTNLWKKISSNLTKNLKNIYYVKTFNIILHELRELGYNLEWQVLNSKNFGIPQNRERVFIVGYLGKGSGRKVFPIGESNTKTLKQLIGGGQGNRVYDIDGISCTQASQAGGQGAKTGLYLVKNFRQQNEKAHCLSATMYKGSISNGQTIFPVLTPDRENKRQMGRRMKENGEPSFTVTAQDKHGIYNGLRIRRLTPKECMRLQGFPDNWCDVGADGKEISDCQKYKMAGNAVTTNVVEAVIKRLF